MPSPIGEPAYHAIYIEESKMNSQERAQLEQFLEGLVAVQGVKKLRDADQFIRQAVARQPDAAYLLVQRCMLLGMALSQANARIAALEESQGSSGSFLEGGYPSAPAGRYASPPPAMAAPAPPPMYAAPGGGLGSFLGQAAATAAGVAGGEFLFEGLEHLFGERNPGFGPEGLAGVPGEENVTINNYYENPDAPQEDMGDDDPSNYDNSSGNDDDSFV
jgi:hypothetical protein